MSIVLQMPKMFLRGSLASETMANLTQEQQKEANWFTDYVANHPDMQRHKRRFLRDVSNTIGGDYRDPEYATQDFKIIIWRGVVILFFHKRYEFECTKCKSWTYKTKVGSTLEIRRRTEVCPNCNCNSDDSTESSPIRAIIVGDRHKNPQNVIDDPAQMSRWFSKQLNNATRQMLRENPIATTTRINLVTDYADTQILSSLQTILSLAKVSNQLVKTDHGTRTDCSIFFDTLAVPSKIIGQLAALRHEAAKNGVIMHLDSTGVKIRRGADCVNVTQLVAEKIHAIVLTPSQVGPNVPSPIEVSNDAEHNHVDRVISKDFLQQVSARLPTEYCKATADIITQQGEWYHKFVAKYGDIRWTWKNIESFLRLSKREMTTIRTQMEAIIVDLNPEAANL